ncbi:uncharacterized protein LOC115245797 [Formica exsecta]|uniref:uncharacterized protein LOC115245797 n=1 Tax=Formica exsecta TaxID=72781 RepID=UPI0011449E7C|nr:uncharacterized protein LOC115245797 [Formica exsecta]
MKGETAEKLSRVYHAVTYAVNAQESIGRPIESHGMDLFNHLVVELFDARTRLEWESSTSDSFETLLNFITKRMLTLNAAKPKTVKISRDSPKPAKTHFTRHESNAAQCALCKERHALMVCGQFKAKPVNERRSFVEAHRLCYNCLGSHPVARSQSTRNCWSCKGQHHSMLHDAYATSKTIDATALSAIKQSDDRKAILLATARVLVADRYGEPHSVRVLIDQGSEVSIVTESLVQRLRLQGNHSSVTIFGIGGSLFGASRGKVALEVTSRVTGDMCSVVAFVLPRLSSYRSSTTKHRKGWPHLQGLPLADPEYMATDPVELLLGAKICSSIFKDGLRKGGPQAPMAQNTILGWILSGGCSVATLHGHLNSLQCTADHDLTTMVRRFWEQEEVPLAPTVLAPEEEKCENFFAQTHTRTSDGRYVVRLPFATTPGNLEETRKPAERLLTAIKRKGSRVFIRRLIPLVHAGVRAPETHERNQQRVNRKRQGQQDLLPTTSRSVA